MQRTKRIFFGNIHAGTRKSHHELFNPAIHGRAFEAMVAWIEAHQEAIKDVVLLGNLFDTWACRHDEKPATIAEIIDGNDLITDGIKRCLKAVTNVFYIRGNHDMELTEEDLKRISGNGKLVRLIPRYHAGLLYAEHGSRFSMLNAPDKIHDPISAYPLGYFITRIISSSEKRSDSPSSIFDYADDILEAAFTSHGLVEGLTEAVSELAGLGPDEKIVMPNGRKSVKIEEVAARYVNLYLRWVEKFGQKYAIRAIQSEMSNLSWFADRLCASNGYRVVVLGQTARRNCAKDIFLVKDRIYANTGDFCPDMHERFPTFVEVDKDNGKFTVQVRQIRGNEVGQTEDPATITV